VYPTYFYNDSTGFDFESSTLVVEADQFGSSTNTVDIDRSALGGVQITLDGQTVDFEPGSITNVSVNTGADNFSDTINVGSTLANIPVTIWAGGGTTNVNFCPLQPDLDTIQGNVSVIYTSSSARSTVSFYDQSNPNDATWTITANGSPTFASITRTGMVPVNLDYVNPGMNVVVYGGYGASNTYNVDSETGGMNIQLNTGEGEYANVNVTTAQGGQTINSDSYNLGVNINGVDGIASDTGSVTINTKTSKLQVAVSYTAHVAGSLYGNITVNGSPDTILQVYDQNDPVAEPWVFSTKTVPQNGSCPVAYGTMKPEFSSASEIDYTGAGEVDFYGGASDSSYLIQNTAPGFNTKLYTGTGVNTANVQGTTGPRYLDDLSPSTNNQIYVGNPTAGVQAIKGNVEVLNNGKGGDALNVDNSAVTGNYTVALAGNGTLGGLEAITGLAPAAIDYTGGIKSRSIATGNTTGLNLVYVQATNVPTNLITDGLQWVMVGNQGSVQNINGPINLGGSSYLTVDDSRDKSGRTATLSTVSIDDGFIHGGIISGLAPASIEYLYTDTKFVDITTGSGTNTVDVLGTGVPTTLINDLGQENVYVGNAASLSGIQGILTVQNEGAPLTKSPAAINLHLADTAEAQGKTATITGSGDLFSITGFAPAEVEYSSSSLKSLVLDGGSGSDTFNVEAVGSGTPVAINTGEANDTVNIGNTSNTLDTIQGPVTVNGGNTDTINVNDQGSTTGHTYSLASSTSNSVTTTTLTRSGAATLTFSSVEKVVVNAGRGPNTFTASSITPSPAVAFNGGSGSSTLVGPNANNTWNIAGTNAGTLDGSVAFSGVQNLTGGTGMDIFQFSAGQGVTGAINGGGGGDWLDYSSYTTTVTVNLATGTATGVGGGISQIQNVRGGQGGNTLTGDSQGNILIGGAGADNITGGSGRSILIGDQGADTITAGSGDTILTGGSPDFDSSSVAHDLALESILAEWQSSDSYATRIAHIKNGGGLNGSNTLVFGVTVHDDGSANTLIGGVGNDWFFQGSKDTIKNLRKGEQVN